MRAWMGVLSLVLLIASCSKSTTCPALPLRCACGGVDPVCTNGQWVCPSTCTDGGGAADLSSSGGGCTTDAECGSDGYCRGLLNVCKNDCQLTIGTPTTGTCHRSCDNGRCACVDDTDCPGFYTSCDLTTHACKALMPPVCHSTCPAACPDGMLLQYGQVCVCATCP